MFFISSFFKILFLILIIFNSCYEYEADSISLCFQDVHDLHCKLANNIIIITGAYFGFSPSHDKLYSESTPWCNKPHSFFNVTDGESCSIDITKNFVKECNGKETCKLKAVWCEEYPDFALKCPKYFQYEQQRTLYIDYQCVSRDLLLSFNHINDASLAGGYISSFGYNAIKLGNKEEYDLYPQLIRSQLPLSSRFKPYLGSNQQILFQFEIIENTIINSSENCAVGAEFQQNYYSLKPNSSSGTNSVTICGTSSLTRGKNIGPIISESMSTVGNINFKTAFINREYFLLKYTAIICQPLVVNNSKITYDHESVQNPPLLHIHVYATVQCPTGQFLLNHSNTTRLVNRLKVVCDQETQKWKDSLVGEICVSDFPKITSTISSTTLSVSTKPYYVSSAISTIVPNSTTTLIPVVAVTNRFVSIGLPIMFAILFVVACLTAALIYQSRYKWTCAATICAGWHKIFNSSSSDDGCIPGHKELLHNQWPPAHQLPHHIQSQYGNGYARVADTPCYVAVSGCGGSFTLSPHAPYRLSNRTLSTVLDGGPQQTRSSRDSIALMDDIVLQSSCNYQPESLLPPGSSPFCSIRGDSGSIRHSAATLRRSQLLHLQQMGYSIGELSGEEDEDRLPSKAHKTSPIARIIRSASNLRHSTPRQPTSFSRQSIIDRCSYLSDNGGGCGSQLTLLRNSARYQPPPSSHVMTCSDISHNRLSPCGPSAAPHSAQQLPTASTAAASSTLDTYLEPELQSQPDKQCQPGSSDYMIYDETGAKSATNNNTSTSNQDCSSISTATSANDLVAPLPNFASPLLHPVAPTIEEAPLISTDDMRRFSMISNNYYGLQQIIDASQQQQEEQQCHQEQPTSASVDHLNPTNSANLGLSAPMLSAPALSASNLSLSRVFSHSTESVYETIDDNLMAHIMIPEDDEFTEEVQSPIERRNLALPPTPLEK